MIINILEELLKEIIIKLNYDIEKVKVIRSNRPDLCDYQCDDVFKLAKIYHKNPLIIGEEIVSKINDKNDFNNYFDKVELIKPGFINMVISNNLINKLLLEMNNKEKFNITDPQNVKTFILDYGGPNVAKPLHVGHLRPAIIGESLKRIIEFKGHKVISDVHLGDYGLQIGQVIYGILNDKLDIDDVTLKYLEDTYPKYSKLRNYRMETNYTKSILKKYMKYL